MVIYGVARELAEAEGLPPDWLNDAVKGLLPGADPDAREVLNVPGLRVSVSSPRYLLALKVQAARIDRDSDDIRFLAREAGASTAEEVLRIAEEVIGTTRLMPKARYIIEELFPPGPTGSPTQGG
ncbi:MAG TPA: hypothetical protein VFJ19_20815 [Nocardioidaceae bacterium]|nr:hypothetical protein [Nocardioidaceae bacterium]